jgi:hypothetical protein
MQVTRRVAIGSAITIGTAGALAGVGMPAASSAETGARPVTVVTSGLDDPFGLKRAIDHPGLLVAEGASGEVTRVFLDGRKRAILKGVPGVAGVAGGPRRVFAVIGGPSPEGGPPPGGKYGPSRLLRMDYRGHHVKVIANLLRYELRHNPDKQVQFVNGQPVDALSNPFGLEWSKFGLFVADGGANDVLKVNPRTGKVRTFFAPRPFRTTKECKAPDANANPGTRGCDPVATGVDVVGRSVYVSFLGAEAPGAARVYKLNARTGKMKRVWRGLTSATGVTARRNGTVYVSHVLEGFPEGAPPPDFDPSSVGQITRISHGTRTHAQVTMPTGMTLRKGRLYSSAWSIGSFLELEHAGQVVRVKGSAFK